VELVPGLLSRVYDGLGNPLQELAEKTGLFLRRGTYLQTLPRDRIWKWTPVAHEGTVVRAGNCLGTVPEGQFIHRIMVPLGLDGTARVAWDAPLGEYKVDEVVAKIELVSGEVRELTMLQQWLVKRPITAYAERLLPSKPLTTCIRF